MNENTNSIQELDKNKINKCICKIECPSGGYVTGFFCKIPVPKREHRLRALITKYSVLGIKSNKSNKEIKIILSNNQITVLKISKKCKRIIFSDEIHDIIMIELNETEDIDIFTYINLLYLDEEFYTYENESVYLIDFSENNINYYVGIIQQKEQEELIEDKENNEKNKDKIEILCFNKKKSLGGPIIFNNELIGIHYGNENIEGNYWDSGIYILNFMFEYYGSIKKKLIYKRHKREITKINVDEIVNKKIKNKNLMIQNNNNIQNNLINTQMSSNQYLGKNQIILNSNSQNNQHLDMNYIPNLINTLNNNQMNQFQNINIKQNNLMYYQINVNQNPNNQNMNNIENKNFNKINDINKNEIKNDKNNIIQKENINKNQNINNENTQDNNKNDDKIVEIEFDDDSFEDYFPDEQEENENEQNKIISKNDKNNNSNKENNDTNLMIYKIQSNQKEKNDLIENKEKNIQIIEENKDNINLISNNSISTQCNSNDNKISEKSEVKDSIIRSKAIFNDKEKNNKIISNDNNILNDFEIIEKNEQKDLLPKEMILKMNIKGNNDITSINENKEIKNNIFEDIYSYINMEKRDIIFIMPNKEKKCAKIPIFFSNEELYFTAYFLIYRGEEEQFIYKNLIKLNYKGNLLKYKDSSIKNFKNNEEIEIEETSIYENINLNSLAEGESKEKISIRISDALNFQKDNSLVVVVSADITCKKLISCISNLNFLDLKRVKINFNFNNKNLVANDTKLKEYINNDKKENELVILIQNIFHLRRKPGKILSVIFKNKKKQIIKKLNSLKVGSLETLSIFNRLLNEKLKKYLEKGDYILQKTFIIEGKKDIKIDLENNKDKSKTLVEKGITKDFTCILSKKKKKKRGSISKLAFWKK